jgi:hypothetical protein
MVKGVRAFLRPASAALLCSLAVLGAAHPVRADDQAPEPAPGSPAVSSEVAPGWRFVGLPLVSYGSDVGLTLGAALFFYRDLAPGLQASSTLSGSWASRGPRSFDLGMGTPRLLGPIEGRINLHLADDARMPYWGEGARLGGLPVSPGYGTPPPEYRYHDRRVFFAAILRGPIAGALAWHVRGRYLNVGVSDPSALLVSSAPPGSRGGRVLLAEAGLLYDQRDRPIATRQGVLLAASAFIAPFVSGISDFAFHGYTVTARAYLPLWPGAALAFRGLYDLKLAGMPWGPPGDRDAVPFFERMLYEGYAFDEGLGSAATLRGIARDRVSGERKLLGNAQLRVNLFTLHLVGKSQEFGGTAGLDAGRAWQPGYPYVDGAGAAVGLRLIWDRSVLLRVELARARGGDQTLYVAFGEQF